MLKLTCNEDVINPLFVYYWLCSPEGQNHIFSRVSHTGVPAISSPLKTLRDILIPVPPKKEQDAIASILCCLDDKIELNRQMNQTLEQMAQALFKSWFVDFDPVVAKAAGKKPFGMSEEIAALFPDKFVDSELGMIPKGWEINTVRGIVELSYGKSLPEKRREKGDIPVYGSNGRVGWHNEMLVKGPGVVVGRKGNAGRVTFAPSDFFPIDTTFYIVPKNQNSNIIFLYYWLSNIDFEAVVGDSAVPGLNRDMAYSFKGVVPESKCAKAFNNISSKWFELMQNNFKEQETLRKLRDTLLPKLLSGEIRVNTAEKLISEAV